MGPCPASLSHHRSQQRPPDTSTVLNYLNGHFRLNRRAYSMALDILFPQPREVPVERGIPVYHRVLETSRWRRDHPDWEGGIVPVDREVGPVRADDAADSQAGSDDEDSNDDVFTPRERRAIRTRVAWLLPDAYRAHLAAEHASGASSGSASSSGSDESFGVSSSSSSGTESSSSSEHTSSSDSSSSSSSSGSSSRNSSSSSPRKRRHEEDDASDASSSITLSEGRSSDRPSTRRRLDSDTQALPAPPGSFPTSANTHPLHAPRTEDRPRKERRQLMRRHRQLLPPIGPPGVRIGGPAIASTSHSQPRDSMSGVVDAHPGRVAHVPAQPVAGSSGEGDREVVVEVPLRRSPKRSRDADTSETSPSQRDGEERDKEDKRKKKRSRKD
ncbi:hypothetical protein C8T65DRAFT_273771 [Cerioporus squamosus]|nr:hypothetical protein C8T65DRAFT_273771 [Cerioporus squamosus]